MTDIHKEGCKLSWQKPEDDGGVPLKEFEIVNRFSSNWNEPGINFGNSLRKKWTQRLGDGFEWEKCRQEGHSSLK